MKMTLIEMLDRTERTGKAHATLSTPAGRVKITERLNDALRERGLVAALNSTLYPAVKRTQDLLSFLESKTIKLSVGERAQYERLDLSV